MLIVQKYGGSSVANAERINCVAERIAEAYREGHSLVVALSAQGDTTDELIDKAMEINSNPSKRELDMLVSTGEQQTVALVAMALHKLGCPAISLNGNQAGIMTSSSYSKARIEKIKTERITAELENKNIVLVAGFQGVNRKGDITTLGRGASDLTAVALAAALHADICEKFTDEEGVYTADPRMVKTARKLDSISYDEMLELASLGANVLAKRSVELAKKYNVKLVVRSSFTRAEGTIVREEANVEATFMSGLAVDKNIARVSIVGIKDVPGMAFKIFSLLSRVKISVDIILQSIGRQNTKDITFTVVKTDLEQVIKILEENKDLIGFDHLSCDDKTAKLSIVGAGMISNPGIASKMFEALFDAGVNIQMISTSEIKISVLIHERDVEKAANFVHDKFISEF